MINRVSESITNILVQKDIISKEDFEIYQFGIDCFIMKSIHILSYFIFAVYFQRIPELLVFLIAFIPLREYAGGYHAKTQLRCYIVSCFAVLSFLILISYIPYKIFYYSIIIAIAVSVFILLIAPVETMNKPLDKQEKTVYKKRAGLLTLIECILVIGLWFTKLYQLSFITSIGLLYVLLIAIIGMGANYIDQKTHKNM
jgi:accessory gene regulator B